MTITQTAVVPAYRPFEVVVRARTWLSPHFVRVTFAGADLDLFGDTCLDQRVKVVLPLDDPSPVNPPPPSPDPYAHFPRGEDWYSRWRQLPANQQNPIRTYTVRGVRQVAGEVDIDFVSHGDIGAASAWVNRAQVGEPCVLVGPDRRGDSEGVGLEWKPGSAGTVLVAGDETAVPAISSILASLPPNADGQVFIEVPTADDVLPLTAPDDVTVTWLSRDAPDVSSGAHHGHRLVSAVTAGLTIGPDKTGRDSADVRLDTSAADADRLWETPTSEPEGDVFAWLAGEASAITTLRRHLVRERGWDRQRIAFMGYWRLGRTET